MNQTFRGKQITPETKKHIYEYVANGHAQELIKEVKKLQKFDSIGDRTREQTVTRRTSYRLDYQAMKVKLCCALYVSRIAVCTNRRR